MNMKAIHEWIIAELKASTLTGSPDMRSASINDMPSKEGVYVAIGQGTPSVRRISDSTEVRITIMKNGRSEIHQLIDEITDVFEMTPGENKVWQVDPRTKNLRLHDFEPVTASPPEAPGTGNKTYSSVLVYNVRGRDIRRT